MKTNQKTALTLAVLLISINLMGCQKTSMVSLTYENSLFRNEDADLTYRFTIGCYEPVAVGDPYAYCASPDLTAHEIPGLDPERFLTEEYAGAATTILYADSITLPDLAALEPETLYVCMTGDRIFTEKIVTDENDIANIVEAFTTGEEAVLPLVVPSLSYDLKFLSEKKLPGIYYNLAYGEFSEGNFLYNESTGRCVEVGSLIQDMME